MSSSQEHKQRYNQLCRDANANLRSLEMTASLVEIVIWGQNFLAACDRVDLISRVPEKSYFMFAATPNGKLKRSRPVNSRLFVSMDDNEVTTLFAGIGTSSSHTVQDRHRKLYSAAMSYFAVADLLNESDQKTPGTFFEIFVGHMIASTLSCTPVKHTTTNTIEGPLTLPTDYIFDLGPNKPRIHLPIKTSTRERAVQVWAHQRILDGMHGGDRFRGILVCFGETNKQDNRSVVEVCVPQQWLAYQRYISKLHRIYYFDPPAKYLALRNYHPPMPVDEFGSFFDEVSQLTSF